MDAKQPVLKTVLALAIGVGMTFAAATAQASTIYVRDGNGGTAHNGGPGSVNLTINVDGSNKSVSAGAFALQYASGVSGPWTDFITYCLEPDELLNVAGLTPVQGTYAPTLAGTEYAPRADALSQLYATYFADSLASATKSAAFQVALWEVAYEADANGFNLATGKFKFTTSGAVLAQAQQYLTNWSTGAQPGVILRIGDQDLVMAPTAVPEPATLALFGLGLLGLAAARRRA